MVVDPNWFNADPDTDSDPAFFLVADPAPDPNADPNPDPVLDQEFWWPKIEIDLQLEIFYKFF